MKNPVHIRFKVISEIRHGSPYNITHLIIDGDFPFNINKEEAWQDKFSWSTNKNSLALIKWELLENEPGFKILTYDFDKNKLYQSNRIIGCCNKIRLKNNLNSKYEVYKLINGKEFGLVIEENNTKNNLCNQF